MLLHTVFLHHYLLVSSYKVLKVLLTYKL